MNNRRFIVIAAVVAVALAVAAWRTARSNHAAEVGLLALAARRTDLTAQLRHWEAELAAATKRSAEPGATNVVEPPPVPAAAAKPPAVGARAADSFLEWLEDPKVQVLFLAKQRADLAQSYGPFFRAQKLTPAQIDRLCDLIIRSRAHTDDLSAINRSRGLSFNDPAMVAQREQGKAEMQAGAIEVLGESGYAQLKDYARALEVRTYVGKIAGAAAVEGMPMNREQTDALVRVLANACPMYPLGGAAQFSRIDWKIAEAQAQAILSPDQMKLLRKDAAGIGPSRRNSELSDAVWRAAREIRAAGAQRGG